MKTGLTSAKLKLVRAAKHLKTLKAYIASYAATEPHRIVRKSNRKGKLNIPKPPPKEISLLAGEIIYQMRSALDHLAFNLVQTNPRISAIAPDWEKLCQFPIRERLPKNCTPPLAKKHFASDLPGICDRAFTFIESLQPYNGHDSAVRNCLRLLNNLSNIDKHRKLNVIRPRVFHVQHVTYESGWEHTRAASLDRGAEIEPALLSGVPSQLYGDRAVDVETRSTAFIAFDEPGALGDANNVAIEVLLEIILEEIRRTIIPGFEKFINVPGRD